MQSSKPTRRKRQDPQSRDFTCKCGKKYLSYAAAYTHVKNKHDLAKDFLQDIGKPQRQKGVRGRPKDNIHLQTSSQARLQVIQQGIVKIYEALIEGNFTNNPQTQYHTLRQSIQLYQSLFKIKIDLTILRTYQTFVQAFVKHFTVIIACKIRIALSLILAQKKKQINSALVVQTVNLLNIWDGVEEVNQIVMGTLEKWIGLGE